MKNVSNTFNLSHDWFSWAPALWSELVAMLPRRERFIEIGSYEGRSTIWTVENMLLDGSSILCIDTWAGGEEHKGEDMDCVESRFNYNISILAEQFPNRPVTKMKCTSYEAIAKQIHPVRQEFDFAYIDGSHLARDVITDACMLWPLMSVGGILVFDDYIWGSPRDVLHRPKLAIDMFTTLFGETIRIIHSGYQLAVQKTAG